MFTESLMRQVHAPRFESFYTAMEAGGVNDSEEETLVDCVTQVANEIYFEPLLGASSNPTRIYTEPWIELAADELVRKIREPQRIAPTSLADHPSVEDHRSQASAILEQHMLIQQALSAQILDTLQQYHKLAEVVALFHAQMDKLSQVRKGQSLSQVWPDFAKQFDQVSVLLCMLATCRLGAVLGHVPSAHGWLEGRRGHHSQGQQSACGRVLLQVAGGEVQRGREPMPACEFSFLKNLSTSSRRTGQLLEMEQNSLEITGIMHEFLQFELTPRHSLMPQMLKLIENGFRVYEIVSASSKELDQFEANRDPPEGEITPSQFTGFLAKILASSFDADQRLIKHSAVPPMFADDTQTFNFGVYLSCPGVAFRLGGGRTSQVDTEQMREKQRLHRG